MKKKRTKKIILFSILAVILSGLVWFFQFYDFGYKMTVPIRPGYTKIADKVYVYDDYGIQNNDILIMLSAARERVNDFFGETKSNPTIIFCDNKNERSYHRGTAQTYITTYISIGSELCNVDVIAHELTHAETHCRILNFWDHFNVINQIDKIPRWFDEGLATQNDYREKYSEETWERDTNNGENVIDLSTIEKGKDFDAGSAEDRRFRYLCSKHEVAEWIKKHGKSALFELLDEIKQDKKFEDLYFKG